LIHSYIASHPLPPVAENSTKPNGTFAFSLR
jgi:hypothetical protein